MRCLQKRPEDRYPDVTALARALAHSSSPSTVSELDIGGTETTLDPIEHARTPPELAPKGRPRAASARLFVLGALAAAAFAAFVPLMASSPPRRAARAVVERSARPLSSGGPTRVASSSTPGPGGVPATPPQDVVAKSTAMTTEPKATSVVTCDPPFVIDPATMTRRVKPGC